MSKQPVQASADDIDVSHVWGTLKSSLPKILLSTLVIGGLTYLGLSLVTPSYSSEARIQLSNGQDDLKRASGASPEELIDKQAVRSQVQVLLSRDLGLDVAKELRLATRAEFNSALDTSLLRGVLGGGNKGTEDQRLMSAFSKNLQVFEVKDSRVIAVRFAASEPKLAADIANALTRRYIANRKTTQTASSKGASDWLLEEVATLRGDLAKAEADAAEFRAKAGLLRGQNESTLNAQQLGELTTQLSQAESEKADAQTRAKLIRSALNRGESIEANPEVLKSPLVQRLMEQQSRVQREWSELSATLLPRHPRMKQLSSELAGVRGQVRREVRKIALSLENISKIASARAATLRSNLDAMKSATSSRSGDMAKIKLLDREAKSKRDLLDTYLARLGDAKARRKVASVPVFAQIIQKATPPSVVDFPKKLPMTLLAMAAMMLVGGGLSITRGLFASARSPHQQSAYSPRYEVPDSATVAPVPAAAPAPVTAPAADPLAAARLEKNDLAFVDSKQVAAHLDSLTQDVTGFRSLVSFDQDLGSAVRKTLQVAGELSRLGRRVLVIDWTAGDSAIATVVGGTSPRGIRELIDGSAQRQDVTISAGEHGCDLITGGRSDVAESTEMSEQINRGFDQFDALYDHVLVCGAPKDVHPLFAQLEGRFDAGLVLATEALTTRETGTFLGYQVPDMAIVRFDGGGQPVKSSSASGLRAQFAPKAAVPTPAE